MQQPVKIVQRFFSKSEATKAKSYQLEQAKNQNRKVQKIEIINAYELYQMNKWFKNSPFKKLGLPTPDQFMIIVHYKSEIENKPKSVKQTKVTEPKVAIDTKAPKIISLLPIVRVSKQKITKRNKKEKPHIFFTHRPNATYRIAA